MLSGRAADAILHRVVIVDDDTRQLRSMRRALRHRTDVELTAIDNGADALVDIGARRPQLVVMDVMMPGLDGIEACRRLKANRATRNIEVVLMSGAKTTELEEAAREAGAAALLSKPVNLEDVIASAYANYDANACREQQAQSAVPIDVAGTRAADLLVEGLVEAGVEMVFGIPGGAISPVYDALLDGAVRQITTRHESGAMFAAAGYARASDKLGVVAVTSGPGILNAMTGIASAWCDGLPVLVLVGEAPRRLHGKGVLQDGSAYALNIIEMTRHITKMSVQVPDAAQLPHMLRRAITTAQSGRKGPVVLTLPLDVLTAMISPPKHSGHVEVVARIDPALVEEVARLLTNARHPLIMAGSGLRGGVSPGLLKDLAERVGCPVVTTPKSKGVFPEGHPLALGVMGLGGHPSAQRYLAGGIDVLAVLGSSLGDLATDGFASQLRPSQALIQVDIEGRNVGRSYAPTHAIVASAGDFLRALVERLPPGRRKLRQVLGGVERIPLPASAETDRIASHDAIAEIQSVLPGNTIFTVDSGEHFLFATHYLKLNEPDTFVVMTGLGSMGQSIGAAIGVGLCHPGRAVAAICGDACFAMNAFEIATAVVERIPIRVFVFNDQRMGMVENGHEVVYGRKPTYSTGPLHVGRIAEGLGASTIRIEHPGQLAEHADLLRSFPAPLVVDVQIDPAVRLPKKDRVAAFAPKSNAAGSAS
ncbi:MAG: thiamine pyrophosphate-binding protein [Kofleriaceae bacterium]